MLLEWIRNRNMIPVFPYFSMWEQNDYENDPRIRWWKQLSTMSKTTKITKTTIHIHIENLMFKAARNHKYTNNRSHSSWKSSQKFPLHLTSSSLALIPNLVKFGLFVLDCHLFKRLQWARKRRKRFPYILQIWLQKSKDHCSLNIVVYDFRLFLIFAYCQDQRLYNFSNWLQTNECFRQLKH